MKKYTVAIAYSGGLDSSILPILLREKYNIQYSEMIACYYDVGQSAQERKKAEQNCKLLGIDFEYIDVQSYFVSDFITWSIMGNSNRNGYSLGTAMTRQLIAERLCAFCREKCIPYIAHGCSGKGNDIIRFHNTITTINPEINEITPIADLGIDRKEERKIAKQNKLFVEAGLSHDINLWNHSIGSGEYIEIGKEIPSEKFLWYKSYESSFNLTFPLRFSHGELVRVYNPYSLFKNSISYTIEFDNGKLVKIDGSEKLINKIQNMNLQLGWMGYGCHEVIEEMISGMKSLEVYESPASDLLITAHRIFEQFVFSNSELDEKKKIEKEFIELIYQGKWFSAECERIRKKLEKNQFKVTGSITVAFDRTRITLKRFVSNHSLYDPRKRSLGDE